MLLKFLRPTRLLPDYFVSPSLLDRPIKPENLGSFPASQISSDNTYSIDVTCAYLLSDG